MYSNQMENRIDRIISLFFATHRMLHEQKEQGNKKCCSYLHLATLVYVKKNNPLMKELADFLGISPPSATSLVDTITKSELLERKADMNDRRVVRVRITKKGERYLEAHKQKVAEILRQSIGKLTAKEQDQLSAILEKISKADK